jgi:hypothetical protein
MTTLDLEKPIFKTSDLAAVMGVSTEYIRRQVHDGKLHATTRRLSHHRHVLRFTLADVRAYDRDVAARLERFTLDVPRATTPI